MGSDGIGRLDLQKNRRRGQAGGDSLAQVRRRRKASQNRPPAMARTASPIGIIT
jgi:hypothetical protein